MRDINDRAADIRLVVFDVDGVLTDGSLYFDADGREFKAFHSHDGLGMKMLRDSGVEIAIITARTSATVAHRMKGLGIEYVYQGRQDKLPVFEELLRKLGLQSQQAAYVGDDIVDLPIMLRVGLAVAVQDSHELVKHHAHWQTHRAGGRGAAREVCELIMEAQGNLQGMFQQYLDIRRP